MELDQLSNRVIGCAIEVHANWKGTYMSLSHQEKLRGWLLWAVLASVPLALANPAAGEHDQPAVGGWPQVQDVMLTTEGGLTGRVLRDSGQAVDAMPVGLQRGEQPLAQLTSDQQGRFAFTGLRGGLYLLTTPEGARPIRAWWPGSAPPRAQAEALIVVGTTVRGQLGPNSRPGSGHYDGAFFRAISHPAVISGLTAAAIAIPLAVDDDDAS